MQKKTHQRGKMSIRANESIAELQREQLYRLANLTAWPASRFNAWLSATFGLAGLDQVATRDQAAAIIQALRAIVEPTPPAATRPPSIRRPGARPDPPHRPQSAAAFFARPSSPDPRASAARTSRLPTPDPQPPYRPDLQIPGPRPAVRP